MSNQLSVVRRVCLMRRRKPLYLLWLDYGLADPKRGRFGSTSTFALGGE